MRSLFCFTTFIRGQLPNHSFYIPSQLLSGFLLVWWVFYLFTVQTRQLSPASAACCDRHLLVSLEKELGFSAWMETCEEHH